MKAFWIALLLSLSFNLPIAHGAPDTSHLSILSFASTNVTTSTYVTLFASTPISANKLVICDTSTLISKLAIGAASSEVEFVAINANGCFQVSKYIPSGSRISIKAAVSTISSGYNTVSLVE